MVAQRVAGPQRHLGNLDEVIGPADAGPVEAIPDEPGLRGLDEGAGQRRRNESIRGGRLEVAAVGEGHGQAGREVPVPDPERPGEAVVPGQVPTVEVPHRVIAVGGGHEAVHPPAIPLEVRIVPRIADTARGVEGEVEVMDPHLLAGPVGVGVRRHASGVQGEAVTPPEHAEVIVEGMVLLHEDHDVGNLGSLVGSHLRCAVSHSVSAPALTDRRRRTYPPPRSPGHPWSRRCRYPRPSSRPPPARGIPNADRRRTRRSPLT